MEYHVLLRTFTYLRIITHHYICYVFLRITYCLLVLFSSRRHCLSCITLQHLFFRLWSTNSSQQRKKNITKEAEAVLQDPSLLRTTPNSSLPSKTSPERYEREIKQARVRSNAELGVFKFEIYLSSKFLSLGALFHTGEFIMCGFFRQILTHIMPQLYRKEWHRLSVTRQHTFSRRDILDIPVINRQRALSEGITTKSVNNHLSRNPSQKTCRTAGEKTSGQPWQVLCGDCSYSCSCSCQMLLGGRRSLRKECLLPKTACWEEVTTEI